MDHVPFFAFFYWFITVCYELLSAVINSLGVWVTLTILRFDIGKVPVLGGIHFETG